MFHSSKTIFSAVSVLQLLSSAEAVCLGCSFTRCRYSFRSSFELVSLTAAVSVNYI